MVEVRIYRDSRKNMVKYIISGHTRYSGIPKFVEYFKRMLLIKEYAGYPQTGRDVVCAAVSSIAQAAVIGITQVLGLKPGLETEDGYLECIIPENIDHNEREKTNIILETMYLALVDLEKQYEKLIKIIEMEV